MKLSRRAFALGLGALASRPAFAFGESSQVDVAELDLGAGTLSRPFAWKRLLYELSQSTSVETVSRSVFLKPEDPALFEHPFAVLCGDGAFAMPSEEGLEQLGRYLSYGGFLVIDDTTGQDRTGFDASVRELASALFPNRAMAPLPTDHSIFRSFFLLAKPVGRLDQSAVLEGIVTGNNAPLVYTRNDLSGALDRTSGGAAAQACVPGGERQRREAVKLAINLVMYALTSDYKKDQAHVTELIREGRLE